MFGIRGVTILLLAAIALPARAATVMWQADGQGGLGLAIDDDTAGDYNVERSDYIWHFGGALSDATVQSSQTHEGADGVAKYREFIYHVKAGATPLTAAIRIYQGKPVALFTLTYEAASAKPLIAFPDFHQIPDSCHVMTFKDELFAPAVFEPRPGGGPWLIFNDRQDVAIISPASHFLIQRIHGDGSTRIADELNPALTDIPPGFTQQTLVAYGRGINETWNVWGRAMTDLQGKTRPANDADIGLKYLGYWTDNGTHYYYNYDPALGYAGTLLSLEDHFRAAAIPVGYFQLDSWWYYKTLTRADGTLGKPKSAKLPQGEWNRYGGLLEYTAHPAVFPQGLQAFQKQLGLPLIAHNRWIDPASPYHQQYNISGVAAVDPRWWEHIISYLHDSGVVTYEQDWLNEIYLHSPAMAATLNTGDQFFDAMAAACQKHGMTMQYCMALPCEFLQGSRYSNLTTIRCSTDRLKRDRWRNFLFTSRLASSLGIWPWTDAYMSSETGNVLLSVLSGGMVGFGDEMGKEDKANLFRAVRADGVIVKPDEPIVPIDSAYLAQARGDTGPLVASTYTDHNGIRTAYVLAFVVPQSGKPAEQIGKVEKAVTRFSLNDIGLTGPAYVYDDLANSVAHLRAGETFHATLGEDGFGYYIVACPGKSGIAFFGDMGKFVSTGKQRIASLRDESGRLTAQVLFAAGESSIRLHGCCAGMPKAIVEGGRAGPVAYDRASQHFTVEIEPDVSGAGSVKVVLTAP